MDNNVLLLFSQIHLVLVQDRVQRRADCLGHKDPLIKNIRTVAISLQPPTFKRTPAPLAQMNRDYKARSGELADVVRLVSTQARQILFMRRALELKPWADRRDSEIKALKQQLADQATALATKTADENQLKADNAKLEDENAAYLLHTGEIELEDRKSVV